LPSDRPHIARDGRQRPKPRARWRDSLPANLEDSAIADQLDELLHLRDAVELAAAELPKGFGRD
jgi:hypothetical protein